jgi:hypothetical protein
MSMRTTWTISGPLGGLSIANPARFHWNLFPVGEFDFISATATRAPSHSHSQGTILQSQEDHLGDCSPIFARRRGPRYLAHPETSAA